MVSLVPKLRLILSVSLTLVLAIAAGCGITDGSPPPTQVAARVNGDEITVHQINAVLAQSPNLAPEDAAAAKREILNRLIDQKIAVQQALKRKLDRSPEVVQAVEAARAEILARSFAQEIARSQPRPSSNEMKAYYRERPELFGRRRVFTMETISVAATQELGAQLKEQTAKSGSMKALADWLRAKEAIFSESSGTRRAEEIPLPLLPTLSAMKNGETRIFDSGGGRLEVIRLVASTPAPVNEATASAQIQQFLYNRGLNEAIANNMKQLKSAATIEYRGEFAGNATAAKDKGKAQPRAQEASKESKAAANTADAQGKARSEKTQSQLPGTEKGVRGLR